MITLQSVFVALVILLLFGLVLDGLLTRSVWVKGGRNGIFSLRNPAHKCAREDEPYSYWFAMIFYSVAMLLLIWLLISGPVA
jgi:ABC-type branched-subunit amino acid transport system permease subunit